MNNVELSLKLPPEVTVWSIQPITVYESLVRESVYYAGSNHSLSDTESIAYNWLIGQMVDRIGPQPKNGVYPIWSWFQWDESKKAKPDLRFKGYMEPGKKAVRLTIKKPLNEVLLSDFVFWNHVFAYQEYVPSSLEDYEQYELQQNQRNISHLFFDDYPVDVQQRITESYTRIFDLNNYSPMKSKSLQATFWSLNVDEVIKVEEFITR